MPLPDRFYSRNASQPTQERSTNYHLQLASEEAACLDVMTMSHKLKLLQEIDGIRCCLDITNDEQLEQSRKLNTLRKNLVKDFPYVIDPHLFEAIDKKIKKSKKNFIADDLMNLIGFVRCEDGLVLVDDNEGFQSLYNRLLAIEKRINEDSLSTIKKKEIHLQIERAKSHLMHSFLMRMAIELDVALVAIEQNDSFVKFCASLGVSSIAINSFLKGFVPGYFLISHLSAIAGFVVGGIAGLISVFMGWLFDSNEFLQSIRLKFSLHSGFNDYYTKQFEDFDFLLELLGDCLDYSEISEQEEVGFLDKQHHRCSAFESMQANLQAVPETHYVREKMSGYLPIMRSIYQDDLMGKYHCAQQPISSGNKCFKKVVGGVFITVYAGFALALAINFIPISLPLAIAVGVTCVLANAVSAHYAKKYGDRALNKYLGKDKLLKLSKSTPPGQKFIRLQRNQQPIINEGESNGFSRNRVSSSPAMLFARDARELPEAAATFGLRP